MKTQLLDNDPLYSTSDCLLYRGLSGFLGNIFVYTTFILIALHFGGLSGLVLLWLATIQGYSAHGATSLTDLEGDTDVRTLRKALALEDNIEKLTWQVSEITCSLKMEILLKQKDPISNNYWLILKGIDLYAYEGDCKVFDMGNLRSFFFWPRFQTSSLHLKLNG